jgi:hypothetical protein
MNHKIISYKEDYFLDTERENINKRKIKEEIGKLHLTSEEENNILVNKYLEGDKIALTKLQEGVMTLVCSLAKKEYINHPLYTVYDLIGAGLLRCRKSYS